MPNLTNRPIVGGPETGLKQLCCCGCGISHAKTANSGHVVGCKCRSCIGRRNRTKGQRRQREAFKAAGGTVKFRGEMGNEESWQSFDWAPMIRWEHKSGRQVPAWVTNAIAQVTAAHDMGVYRPGLMVQSEGSNQVWCLLTLDDLKNQCLALAQVGQSWKIRSLARDVKRAAEAIEGLTR